MPVDSVSKKPSAELNALFDSLPDVEESTKRWDLGGDAARSFEIFPAPLSDPAAETAPGADGVDLVLDCCYRGEIFKAREPKTVQQTCRGPFSSVSTLLIARVGAFFKAFFEIYKICIPSHRSEIRNLREFRQHFWPKFHQNSIKIIVSHADFHEISS